MRHPQSAQNVGTTLPCTRTANRRARPISFRVAFCSLFRILRLLGFAAGDGRVLRYRPDRLGVQCAHVLSSEYLHVRWMELRTHSVVPQPLRSCRDSRAAENKSLLPTSRGWVVAVSAVLGVSWSSTVSVLSVSPARRESSGVGATESAATRIPHTQRPTRLAIRMRIRE